MQYVSVLPDHSKLNRILIVLRKIKAFDLMKKELRFKIYLFMSS